jgi:hypothetical protein
MYSVLALHKFYVQDTILEHPGSGVILTGHRSRNRGEPTEAKVKVEVTA